MIEDVECFSLLGCPITRMSLDDCVDHTERFIRSGRPHYIAVVNAAKLVKMRTDPELKRSVLSADLIGADGVPVVWACRLLGQPLPGRVNGTDLMDRLLARANEMNYRIFFFGARPEVLDKVLDRVRSQYPGVAIAGSHHGYFTPQQEPGIVEAIHEARADIIFIAISTPAKELWVKNHLHEMGVPVCHGVGGSFDVFAGVVRRAPIWMQRNGLEWLYRVYCEPGRMWRRYLVTNTFYIALVFRDWLRFLFGGRPVADHVRKETP